MVLYKHKNIPAVFHNLNGYDGHFIIQEISRFQVDVSALSWTWKNIFNTHGDKNHFHWEFKIDKCKLEFLGH